MLNYLKIFCLVFILTNSIQTFPIFQSEKLDICPEKSKVTCLNDGVCRLFGREQVEMCFCKTGYKGENCENHDCYKSNCMGLGVCVDGINCACMYPFYGDQCQHKLDVKNYKSELCTINDNNNLKRSKRDTDQPGFFDKILISFIEYFMGSIIKKCKILVEISYDTVSGMVKTIIYIIISLIIVFIIFFILFCLTVYKLRIRFTRLTGL